MPSSLPPSAHSSCQMAMWPTWASWRQAPTPMPPQDLQEPLWPKAATLWPPLWTSSGSRASCFDPEAPARWTVRVQEHLPPPWLEARLEVSASSWTVRSEGTLAGTGLFIDSQGASVTVEGWGPHNLYDYSSVLLPFVGGWGTQPPGEEGGSGLGPSSVSSV